MAGDPSEGLQNRPGRLCISAAGSHCIAVTGHGSCQGPSHVRTLPLGRRGKQRRRGRQGRRQGLPTRHPGPQSLDDGPRLLARAAGDWRQGGGPHASSDQLILLVRFCYVCAQVPRCPGGLRRLPMYMYGVRMVQRPRASATCRVPVTRHDRRGPVDGAARPAPESQGSPISSHPSAIHQPSISHQPSAISHQPSAFLRVFCRALIFPTSCSPQHPGPVTGRNGPGRALVDSSYMGATLDALDALDAHGAPA